jgi:hypothetical protein
MNHERDEIHEKPLSSDDSLAESTQAATIPAQGKPPYFTAKSAKDTKTIFRAFRVFRGFLWIAA